MVKFPVKYTNGGYQVEIHQDGTKIRTKLAENATIQFPEHMDIKITDWCDAGCAWCHEKSTPAGKHGNLKAAVKLLEDLPAGIELAIGGGDPLAHPDFSYFVEALTEQGKICNVTVNGKHFDKHLPTLEHLVNKGALHGIGYSFQGTIPEWEYPNLVIHMITGVHSPVSLDGLSPKKLLLLGYKNFGRGADLMKVIEASVQSNILQWYRELYHVITTHHVSFDNLAIEQLNPKRLFVNMADYDYRHMGAEGSFGLYVDAVKQEYALASYCEERFPWSNLKDMHQHIRKTYLEKKDG